MISNMDKDSDLIIKDEKEHNITVNNNNSSFSIIISEHFFEIMCCVVAIFLVIVVFTIAAAMSGNHVSIIKLIEYLIKRIESSFSNIGSIDKNMVNAMIRQ